MCWRIMRDMEIKPKHYDKHFPLDALTRLLPTSAVALGMDRMIMLAVGATSVDQVQWAPVC